MLVGGRCAACATHMFPPSAACPRCGGGPIESVDLPTTGTVWSWTVQRFPPKPPYRAADPYEPFAVGYVDLGPVIVESPLTGRPVDGWAIGDAVTLVPGEPFAFAPAAGEG